MWESGRSEGATDSGRGYKKERKKACEQIKKKSEKSKF
jgi:hypothetical protein